MRFKVYDHNLCLRPRARLDSLTEHRSAFGIGDLPEITVGTRVYYDQQFGISTGMLDSNVILRAWTSDWATGCCTLAGVPVADCARSWTGLGRSPGSVPASMCRRRAGQITCGTALITSSRNLPNEHIQEALARPAKSSIWISPTNPCIS